MEKTRASATRDAEYQLSVHLILTAAVDDGKCQLEVEAIRVLARTVGMRTCL